ncbi:cation-translocating P-type ATPase [uncultured Fluviicola sp.]|uniref:cation-translocating P-type ATPase n=1 Tax=uncultured Fluviicola sp. TaxID=463303 RepID=UPI0025CE64BB|nr:cation-translocating P-type ATPase [uncultured Fluviicola sp.]
MLENTPPHLTGLTDEELKISRSTYGYNQAGKVKKVTWYGILLDILKEPMLLLLIAVAAIYVVVGNYSEAVFMLGAIVIVSGISFYQDNRSKKALETLEKLNEPLSRVIRNVEIMEIPTREIAVGDLCVIEEGKMINADGEIVHSNDFSVNESSLTGESFSVFKSQETEDKKVYSGTLVVSGLAVFKVQQIGGETKLGKIGRSIQEIKEVTSPLQLQITRFVKWMAIAGFIVFLMVWAYSFWKSGSIIESLLAGLTLAMSILPEEIPVAFTTFMALGAWKLMREGIIIKRSSVVETLGSTTVICTDKTGTITENSMHLKALFDHRSNRVFSDNEFGNPGLSELIRFAMWSSEPVPFDPMEKTLHRVYEEMNPDDQRTDFHMVHEYPLEGKPPMMTHVFENGSGERIIAAKGAPEAILAVSDLKEAEKEELRKQIQEFGMQGYRILGVAKCNFPGVDFPQKQQDLDFVFLGFTVFYDPPKKHIQQVFQTIYDAGIQVKVITGDNAETTKAIARQAGIRFDLPALNGAEIMEHTAEELRLLSKQTTLFTRMFPEVKLAMVNALKQNGEVVAMLGDGVNDAPALKAAHIGVAMGSKGTEIAKAAASLVIINDDLDKLIIGITAGRRIYTNLKKAVQYIISIHIPIILTVSLPLFFGWIYPHIFTPLHVIFLELIMGPTCSIVYENEPTEKNTMLKKPRKMSETFLNWKELSMSVLQGIVITIGVLGAYQLSVQKENSEEITRAMVFTTLIFANVFLSLANRSFFFSMFASLKNKNRLFPLVIGTTLVLLTAILYVPPIARFFRVAGLGISELGISFLIASASVLWFEVYKWYKRKKGLNKSK